MNFFRRNQLLLFLFLLLLLVASLVLLWRFSPFPDIAKLWNQSDIRSTILGIVSAVVGAAIIGIFVLFRNSVLSGVRSLLVPGKTKEERKRWELEQIYLDNLIETFNETVKRDSPWDVKKYTDLEAFQKDQDKQAHIVRTHLWRLPGSEDVHTEGSLGGRVNLQSFLRHEKGPIMIKGDPGTGKTLTILRFAVDQASRAKNNAPSTVKIPVYISLSSYTGRTKDGDPEPVFDFIEGYLREKFPSAVALYENLNDYLIHGHLLLLFDGLNELLPDEYLSRSQKLEEFVFRLYPSNKAIFTCRTPRYTPESKFVTVEISNLDNEQIERFIAAYRGEKAAKTIYQDLMTGDGFMLRICRNPFMLRMLVSRDESRPLPETPAQLFEEYVQDQLSFVSQNAKQTADVLREMAFAMQKGGQFAGAVAYDWLKAQLPGVTLDEHLKIAHQKNLLNYTSEKDIRFYHQILQEYFAATALKREWETGKSVATYFSDYRWEDTILVCAGLIKDTEKFIREVWSPGQNSPERFWLATKAVGISGVRVGPQYYDAVTQEAIKYLDPGGTTDSYSKTALAVDTVKAFSYIDDERTAIVLSETLVASDGWVRELCMQVLGSSRQKSSHDLLRLAVIKLRSFQDLLLVAPYFSRTEWLAMVANSTISFDMLTNVFWQMTRLLWFVAPGIYLALLLFGSQFFKVDPLVLLGRVLAVSILAQITVNNFRNVIPILRTQETLSTKLRRFRAILSSEVVFIVLAITLWFFSSETLLLLGILLRLLGDIMIIAVGIAIILNIFNPLRLAHILYSWAGRVMVFIFAINVASISSIFFLPSLWHTPSNFNMVYSPVASAILYIFSFLQFPPLINGIILLATIMGIASIFIHLITYMKYWRLRQYCVAFIRKGNTQAAQRLVQVVLNRSEWPYVRTKAIKNIRLINLPLRYIGALDALLEGNELEQVLNDESWKDSYSSIFENKVNMRRELERTVYELIDRAREKERETPDEEYLATLVNRGKARYQAGYYQEALTYLNQAITLNGKYTVALSLRGAIHLQMEHYHEALADLDQALIHNPQDVETLALRGEMFYLMERYQEALVDLDQAIALDWKDAQTFALRGETHQQLGQYQEALLDFNQALALENKDGRTLFMRGETYRQMRQYPEALADLNQAITFDAENDWFHYERALIYLLTGQKSEFEEDMHSAIQLAQDATSTEEDKWRTSFNLALYKLVSGGEADAQAQYEQLRTTCSTVSELQEGVNDLADFLSIQPSHQLARNIHAQLQARIDKLKDTSAIPHSAPLFGEK